MPNQGRLMPRRFHSLDALRGLASLSVVLWHWQQLFSGTEVACDAQKLPGATLFHLFYTQGWLAVDLFFCLSGFVFYWRYSRAVADGTVTALRFAVLRFSRLYPLHLATLLLVAAGQLWMVHTTGHCFVYGANDARHFVLNLLLASSWGLESGASFNAPIWSVSVEILLYAAFFACCRIFPVRLTFPLVASITGLLVLPVYYAPVGRGVGFFFMGGCVFLAYEWIMTAGRIRQASRWIPGLTAGLILLLLVAGLLGVDGRSLSLRSIPFAWRLDAGFSLFVARLPAILLFPSTILSLALIETVRGSWGRRFSFLGDISYSTYLLHFPLQLAVAILTVRGVVHPSWFYTPWFLVLFFAVLVLLSLTSYHCFEAPARRLLRRCLSTDRLAECAPACS